MVAKTRAASHRHTTSLQAATGVLSTPATSVLPTPATGDLHTQATGVLHNPTPATGDLHTPAIGILPTSATGVLHTPAAGQILIQPLQASHLSGDNTPHPIHFLELALVYPIPS